MIRIALAAVAMLWAGQAVAAVPCGDSASIVKQLAGKHNEAPVARGLQSNGSLMELYASPDGETWTAISTTPQGLSCIVASGKWLQMLPPVIAETGSPT